MTDRELFEFIDVEAMLNELDIRNVRNTYSGEIQFSCPFSGHNHLDNNPSASMTTVERQNVNGGFVPKTTFYCFTCGAKGNAITFLADYEKINVITAKRFLRERFVGDLVSNPSDLAQKIMDLMSIPEKPKVKITQILDEKEVDDRWVNWPEVWMEWMQTQNSPEPFNYMLDRGFEPETLMDFGVGYDLISQRFSIPLRDHEGLLVGFKGRAWWPDARPKYLALGGDDYNFETPHVSRILFALHIAKRRTETEPMIVREGELNTMFMHQLGWTNTVGLSGSQLSEFQIDLIKKYANSAIMYFDKEADGLKAARKLEKHMPVWVCHEYERDPNDCTKEEIQQNLEDAESSVAMGIRQMC